MKEKTLFVMKLILKHTNNNTFNVFCNRILFAIISNQFFSKLLDFYNSRLFFIQISSATLLLSISKQK